MDKSEGEIERKRKFNIFESHYFKEIFIRIMCFFIMCIFLFCGAINRVYARSTDSAADNSEISDNDESDDSESNVSNENKSSSNDSDTGSLEKGAGVSAEGQKYTYDAVKVSQKMKKGDYSNNGEKVVFLTFDDGASNTVTPKILKVLDDYKVKATFFVMGQSIMDGGETSKSLIKKEYEEGHAIGNHSYSHDYHVLYPNRNLNLDSFVNDYKKNDDLLKEILGEDFKTRVIRCPGGFMSWKNMSELDTYLNENNMAEIDWTALSGDAEGKPKNADELANEAIKSSKGQEMVVLLMHDTYGKEETAKSLPKIIEYFKNEGYEFKTLS